MEKRETLLALGQAEITSKYEQGLQARAPVGPGEDADLSLYKVTDSLVRRSFLASAPRASASVASAPTQRGFCLALAPPTGNEGAVPAVRPGYKTDRAGCDPRFLKSHRVPGALRHQVGSQGPRGEGKSVDLGWRDARPLAWLSLEGALVGT
ncbi:uncharacterized protein AAG666_010487 isoform 1-T1 [Megaptera novaeangliae]